MHIIYITLRLRRISIYLGRINTYLQDRRTTDEPFHLGKLHVLIL